MKYRTELMEKILQSPEAMRLVEMISPVYGEAYAFLWLLQVTAMELEEITNFPEEFRKQVTPVTATWAIDYWEKAYGIIPDKAWTLEQRRQNVISQIIYRAPMNPEKLRRTVENILGIDTEIKENTGKNRFTVVVHGWVDDFKKARETIDKGKPAHLIYDVVIAEFVKAYLKAYYDIKVSESEQMRIDFKDNPTTPDVCRVADEDGVIMLDETGAILIY